jgi:hypothetical protein
MIDRSDKRLEEFLALFSLTEILEQSDLTKREAVYILYRVGHIALPPFLEDLYGPEEQWDANETLSLEN